jgi:hypothetical protein
MEISGSDLENEDHDRGCERTNRRRRHQEVTDIPREVLDGGGNRMKDKKGARKMGGGGKLRGFSPQANYTDRATEACRRS